MTKATNFLSSNRLKAMASILIGVVVLCLLSIVTSIVSCNKEPIPATNENKSFSEFVASSRNNSGNSPPPDSFVYDPVEWGETLFIDKRTITFIDRRGVKCWQALGFGQSVITPTRYQQLPGHDRVVFGDNDTIRKTDIFLICRPRKVN